MHGLIHLQNLTWIVTFYHRFFEKINRQLSYTIMMPEWVLGNRE